MKKRRWLIAAVLAAVAAVQTLAPVCSLATDASELSAGIVPAAETAVPAAPLLAEETVGSELSLPADIEREERADAVGAEAADDSSAGDSQITFGDLDPAEGCVPVAVSTSRNDIYGLKLRVEADDPVTSQSIVSLRANSADVWSGILELGQFGYAPGVYRTYAIATYLNKAPRVIAAAEFVVRYETGSFAVAPIGSEDTRFEARLTGAALPDGAEVWFTGWSEGAEQPIMTPQHAEKGVNGYTASLYAGWFDRPGRCTVEARIGSPQGPAIAQTDFNIRGLEHGAAVIRDVDGTEGSFTVDVTAEAPSGVRWVDAAVWSRPDQSDLVWTRMTSENGRFVFRDSVSRHAGFGTYTIHAYAGLGNGQRVFAGGTTASIDPRNYPAVTKAGTGSYQLRVLGAEPQSAAWRVGVWSEAGGQDDLVWYACTRQNDGSVLAAFSASSHKHGGRWFAHAYADDAFVCGTEFTVPDSEVGTEAERRIAADCQKVYQEVGTDLYANYMWVVRSFSYVRRSGHLTPPAGYTREQWYAVEGLEKRSGNCYTFAASFCELARGLGYDATYIEGAVYGVGQRWWPHGFVLIHLNGSTYICDPELQYASASGRNLYMQPISSPKATYRW